MSFLNSNPLTQGLFLAGSLSLYSGTALAQPASTDNPASHPEGRAGIATLCIEKRSYVDLGTKRIITPDIYINAMPVEGIDTGYVEGNEAFQKWKEFLNPADPVRKKWLEDTDIPDQANAAFDLMKKLDKDKNGIITPGEFEEGEKGKTEEDRLIDLAFLTSLRCDNLFFTEGALHKIDLDEFPEVAALKKSLAASETKAGELGQKLTGAEARASDLGQRLTESESALSAERIKSRNFLWLSAGLGALALGLGIFAGISRARRKQAPTPPGPQRLPLPPTPPARTPNTAVAPGTPAQGANPPPPPVAGAISPDIAAELANIQTNLTPATPAATGTTQGASTPGSAAPSGTPSTT